MDGSNKAIGSAGLGWRLRGLLAGGGVGEEAERWVRLSPASWTTEAELWTVSRGVNFLGCGAHVGMERACWRRVRHLVVARSGAAEGR